MFLNELFNNIPINEIRMDPTSLEKAASELDARVGIEFEMIVPVGQEINDQEDMEQDYDLDEPTGSIHNILDFFNDGDYNGRLDIRRLEAALQSSFAEWLDEQFAERWEADKAEYIYIYIKENLGVPELAGILGLDPNEVEGFTRNQLRQAVDTILTNSDDNRRYEELIDEVSAYARETFMENADDSEWLGEVGLNTMQDIESEYPISWPHWRYPVSDKGDVIQRVADEFSAAVGRPVNASVKYHGAYREPGKYAVEPDGSINAGDDEIGLEFISPPLSVPEMLQDLNNIKKWADSVGAYTNNSTGLHMNVSIPGLNDQTLDYVKLALLLGDQYVLQQFNRQTSTYAKSALEKIQDKIKTYDQKTIEQYLTDIKGKLNKKAGDLLNIQGFGKYTSINPKTGYIEFRSPGGDYLNEPIEKIVNTLRRFIVATAAAIDPNAYRQEYISKLVKLLTPSKQKTDDTIEYFAKFSAGQLPKQALKSFIRQAQLQRKVAAGRTDGQKMWWRVGHQTNPNFAIEVVGATREEAIQSAIDNDTYLRTASSNPFTVFTAQPIRPYVDSTSPTPELNGRPSNPDGNTYIATAQDPDTPLYRFMAANGDDARAVLDQWTRQYGGNYIYRIDHLQLRGQPRQTTAPNVGVPEGQERIERYLRMADQAANANYEIVRRDNYQPVFLFIANTPQDASRVLERYLDLIGLDHDSEEFGFRERAIPGSTLDIQRQRAAQSAQAAVQSTSGNRLWQIVDSADGEVAYEFYLSAENNQQDANEVGSRWIRNNGNPNTTYSVREQPQETGTISPQNQPQYPSLNLIAPELNPDANYAIVRNSDNAVIEYYTRNTPAEAQRALQSTIRQLFPDHDTERISSMYYRVEPVTPRSSLQPQSVQWRILIDGEEVHRFWNRNVQSDANAAARQWVLNQIRSGLLSPAEGAEIEVVPVTANDTRPQAVSSGPRNVPGRDYYVDDEHGRFELIQVGSSSSPNNYRFNLPRDIMRGAGYLESANLNAVRYLRDIGIDEDNFNNYVIMDRVHNTQHEVY